MKTLLLVLFLLTSALGIRTAALEPTQVGKFQCNYYPTKCAPGYTAASGQIRITVDAAGRYSAAVDDDYVIQGTLTPRGNFGGITITGIKFRGKINKLGQVTGRYRGPKGTCKGRFAGTACPACF